MVREELIDWKLYACGANGQIYSYLKKRFLNGTTLSNGYVLTKLKCIDGKYRLFYWHRVIYTFFYGTIPEGMQVNHISEVKTDNRLVNLNLMTPKENTNWGTRNERVVAKESKPVVAIDVDGNIVHEFSSIAEAARQLGLHHGNISSCYNGKRKTCGGYGWRHP